MANSTEKMLMVMKSNDKVSESLSNSKLEPHFEKHTEIPENFPKNNPAPDMAEFLMNCLNPNNKKDPQIKS